MLCPSCKRQVARGATACGVCGRAVRGRDAPLDLVLRDGTRVPILGSMTIGRAEGNTIQLAEPTVSRMHARISAEDGGVRLEDAGSSSGTYLFGRRVASAELQDGAQIRLG